MLLLLFAFIYVSIRKMDAVRKYYEGVQNRVRAHFYDSKELSFDYHLLSVRSSSDPMITSRWFRVEYATELTIAIFQIIALVLQVLVVTQLFTIGANSWRIAFTLMAFAVGLVSTAAPYVVAGRLHR